MSGKAGLLLALVLAIRCGALRPVDVATAALSAGGRAGSSEYTPEAEADRVAELPGWGPIGGADEEFKALFAGYITVDEEAGRALFYLFVESRNSDSDPMTLWLNGGPGCSSIGGGFMSELGPFYPTEHGHLRRNKYGWHKASSMLFLESPAFVGWSYSNTTADRIVGDKRTAVDSREFLLRWFDRFPQFKRSDFWLSGESYGGHYIPNLAAEIVRGNAEEGAKNRGKHINLKGFLVGNAWTNPVVENESAVAFWHSHSLISDAVREGLNAYCDYSSIGPLAAARNSEYVSASPDDSAEVPPARAARALQQQRRQQQEEQEEDDSVAGVRGGAGGHRKKSDEVLCDEFVNEAFQQISGINIYDIFADVCIRPSAAAAARQLGLLLRGHPAGMSTRPLAKDKYDPCIDDLVTIYLNRPDVQRALHANTTGLPWPWQTCTPLIKYSRSDLLTSMIPVYKELLKSDLSILVYSGDVDAIVPVIGTRRWIRSLDLPLKKDWRAWHSSTKQVGGWTTDYEGLTFASVRGAGHMVPYTQPERAFHLFTSWIAGQALDELEP